MNQPVSPRAVSLASCVAEDALVGHQWEERPLVLPRSYRGMPGPGGRSGWLGEQGSRGEYRGLRGSHLKCKRRKYLIKKRKERKHKNTTVISKNTLK